MQFDCTLKLQFKLHVNCSGAYRLQNLITFPVKNKKRKKGKRNWSDIKVWGSNNATNVFPLRSTTVYLGK